VRAQLAAAVAFAARRLWRRRDLETADQVILDLLVEALYRLGVLYRPGVGLAAADALASAPRHVRVLVDKLLPVAFRPAGGGVVIPAGPAGKPASQHADPLQMLASIDELVTLDDDTKDALLKSIQEASQMKKAKARSEAQQGHEVSAAVQAAFKKHNAAKDEVQEAADKIKDLHAEMAEVCGGLPALQQQAKDAEAELVAAIEARKAFDEVKLRAVCPPPGGAAASLSVREQLLEAQVQALSVSVAKLAEMLTEFGVAQPPAMQPASPLSLPPAEVKSADEAIAAERAAERERLQVELQEIASMEEEESAARLRQAKCKREGGDGQDSMFAEDGGFHGDWTTGDEILENSDCDDLAAGEREREDSVSLRDVQRHGRGVSFSFDW